MVVAQGLVSEEMENSLLSLGMTAGLAGVLVEVDSLLGVAAERSVISFVVSAAGVISAAVSAAAAGVPPYRFVLRKIVSRS